MIALGGRGMRANYSTLIELTVGRTHFGCAGEGKASESTPGRAAIRLATRSSSWEEQAVDEKRPRP